MTPIPNDDAAVHQWLCHPRGDACDGGATCSPNPVRLRAYQAKPVCPRCLDIEPGVPGGTPDAPHLGPFTPNLCQLCDVAVDRARMLERSAR